MAFNAGLVGISVAFLIISYILRVLRLYRPLSQTVEKWIRYMPMDGLQKRYEVSRKRTPLSRCKLLNGSHKALLLIVLTLAEAIFQVGDSVLWEILWLSSAVAWGTLRLVGIRKSISVPSETSWGYGQVLTLGLCILPVWYFFNTLFEQNPPSTITNSLGRIGLGGQRRQNSPVLHEIERTVWFRSLIWLIVGTAIIFAALTLFESPAAAFTDLAFSFKVFTDITDRDFAIVLFTAYIILLAACIVIWVAFVSICLAFHFRQKNRQQPRQRPCVQT